MARGVNKVIIVGNAGNDAEVKFMPSGAAVANVNIATTESWKGKQTGEMQERTEWHRVAFMDRGNFRLGQIAGDFIKKGSKVYVEGSLRTREWEKDGIKRYTTEIIANEMQLLDSKGEVQSSGNQPAPQQGGFNQQPQPQPRPQQFSPQNPAGTPTDPWADYVPTGTAASASIEQIKAKAGGNLEAALNNGWLAPKPKPQQAPNFDDFDSDIPF